MQQTYGLIVNADELAECRVDAYLAELRAELITAIYDPLPGNHSAAETVLMAHLSTSSDGYHRLQHVEWSQRPTKGWQTTFSYLPDLGSGLATEFVIEARCDTCASQLAILIDCHDPNHRTARKRQQEAALLSAGFRVVMFTEQEILTRPDGCREIIETHVSDLVDQVLADAGLIRGRH